MQHTSVPAPLTSPDESPRKLAPVQAPPKRSNKGWIWLVCFIAASAGAYWLYQRHLADEAVAAKRSITTELRTTSVNGGKIIKSMRVTGTTGPEKYVTILGPQLRGSRTFQGGGGAFMGRGGGGPGGGGQGGGGGSQNASSSGSSGSSGSSSSTSSTSSASSSATGTVTSNSSAMNSGLSSSGGSGGTGAAVGGVRSSTTAMQATTTRSGSGGGGGGRNSLSSGTGGGGGPSSASMGGDGLGSTSAALAGTGTAGGGGGGGGGGAPSDFGSVLQKLVKPGSHVAKGDMLAEFDRQFMMLRVDDYKAGVQQQELNLRKMKADLDVSHKAHDQQVNIAKGDVEKAELDLKTIPVRSEIESERYRLTVEEAKAKYKQLLEEVPFVLAGEESQVRISEMDLQQSKLELRRSEVNADRLVMKAAMDGMVVMNQIWRGGDFGQVQEGDQVMPGMGFMQIVDPSSMVVNALVNQVDVERIRVGAKARVHVDAFPDLELPAHVYSVGAMPRNSGSSGRASFVKEIPIVLKLDKIDARVIPDLSVSGDIVIQEEESAALAPLGAVFRDSADAKPHVFVKKPDGWVKRSVELGLADNLFVAIKSGLQQGDVIAEEKPPLVKPEDSKSAVLRRRRQYLSL